MLSTNISICLPFVPNQSSMNCICFMPRNNNTTCFPSKFIEKAFSESLNRYSFWNSYLRSLIVVPFTLIKCSPQNIKFTHFLFFNQCLSENTTNNAINFYVESSFWAKWKLCELKTMAKLSRNFKRRLTTSSFSLLLHFALPLVIWKSFSCIAPAIDNHRFWLHHSTHHTIILCFLTYPQFWKTICKSIRIEITPNNIHYDFDWKITNTFDAHFHRLRIVQFLFSACLSGKFAFDIKHEEGFVIHWLKLLRLL